MVKLNNLIRINFKVITFYLISGYIFLSVLRSTQNFSGDYDMEVIPVPIPNTEVKPIDVDDIYEYTLLRK